MPRCPQCSQFVSYETVGELSMVDVDGPMISGTIRLVKQCVDCSEELEDFEEEFEINAEHDCDAVGNMPADADVVEVVDEEPEIGTDSRTVGGSRRPRTYITGTAEFEVKCLACFEVFYVRGFVECQASDFNSLV